MGLLDRLGRALRSQINSLIQETEDPEKILEEAVLAMEQELIKMRQGLAEAIASQKRTERELYKQKQAAQTWRERAQLALSKGDEQLARDALVKWQSYQTYSQPFQAQLEQQNQIISKLRKDLQELEHKYAEAKAKKSLYLARLRSASAAQKMQQIMGNLNTSSSLTIFEQIEGKILELESEAELMSGINKDPLEGKFAALEKENALEGKQQQLEQKAQSLRSQNPVDLELEKLRAELDQI